MAKARGFLESPLGFPASSSLAWCGFHRSMSYGLSTGIDREPHGKDSVCCVDIAVMMDATFRAVPLTDIKWEGVEEMTTLETAFTGGIPLVNFDQASTIPVGLVFELGHKLTPSSIADRFTQCWMLDHVLHCQRLDTYHAGSRV